MDQFFRSIFLILLIFLTGVFNLTEEEEENLFSFFTETNPVRKTEERGKSLVTTGLFLFGKQVSSLSAGFLSHAIKNRNHIEHVEAGMRSMAFSGRLKRTFAPKCSPVPRLFLFKLAMQ